MTRADFVRVPIKTYICLGNAVVSWKINKTKVIHGSMGYGAMDLTLFDSCEDCVQAEITKLKLPSARSQAKVASPKWLVQRLQLHRPKLKLPSERFEVSDFKLKHPKQNILTSAMTCEFGSCWHYAGSESRSYGCCSAGFVTGVIPWKYDWLRMGI